MMFCFPKGLYADVRIEEKFGGEFFLSDGKLGDDSSRCNVKAIVRVFDGEMWYTSAISETDEIQEELNRLSMVATPNETIYEHPDIKGLQVHRDTILRFEGEEDIRKISESRWIEMLREYQRTCFSDNIPEVTTWYERLQVSHTVKSFYSSKGAELVQDMQDCWLNVGYGITVDDMTSYGAITFSTFTIDELCRKKDEILEMRDRYLDFYKNAVDIEPGEYTCVFSPVATGLFTHECFGHKSEADGMLGDELLRKEWTLGKKVANEKVSICDSGALLHHGYTPYDEEGTKANETWLIKDGILSGRLHNAKTAAYYGESLTGNARADGANSVPIVRMTNTYTAAGQDDPEEMIKEVKDGLYVYNVNDGTGRSEFTLNPDICYRIRDGRICEPVRVHVISGNVSEALFDIDAVGNDFVLADARLCGKEEQLICVSMGGPSIRVKKLSVW